jgi:hypothetical protein
LWFSEKWGEVDKHVRWKREREVKTEGKERYGYIK